MRKILWIFIAIMVFSFGSSQNVQREVNLTDPSEPYDLYSNSYVINEYSGMYTTDTVQLKDAYLNQREPFKFAEAQMMRVKVASVAKPGNLKLVIKDSVTDTIVGAYPINPEGNIIYKELEPGGYQIYFQMNGKVSYHYSIMFQKLSTWGRETLGPIVINE